MSHVVAVNRRSFPSSPTSSETYLDNRSDPMDLESPVKGLATNFRYSPYPKRPAPCPAHKHPYAMPAQSRGSCADSDFSTGESPSPSDALRIFMRGIETLPNRILRSAVLEKYALAEKSRLQLLIATWDLEGVKRRIDTLKEIQSHFESTLSLAESEYKFWMSMYTDRNLPDLEEDELFYGRHSATAAQEADRDSTELTFMVEHARKRGLNVAAFDDGSSGDGGAMGPGSSAGSSNDMFGSD